MDFPPFPPRHPRFRNNDGVVEYCGLSRLGSETWWPLERLFAHNMADPQYLLPAEDCCAHALVGWIALVERADDDGVRMLNTMCAFQWRLLGLTLRPALPTTGEDGGAKL